MSMDWHQHWAEYAKSERGARQLGFMLSAAIFTCYAFGLTGLMEYAGGVAWKPIYRATMPLSLSGYLILLCLPLVAVWNTDKQRANRFLATIVLTASLFYTLNYLVFDKAAGHDTRTVWRASMSVVTPTDTASLYRLIDSALRQQREDKKPWLGRMATDYDELENVLHRGK